MASKARKKVRDKAWKGEKAARKRDAARKSHEGSTHVQQLKRFFFSKKSRRERNFVLVCVAIIVLLLLKFTKKIK